jgi:hypothetical protein
MQSNNIIMTLYFLVQVIESMRKATISFFWKHFEKLCTNRAVVLKNINLVVQQTTVQVVVKDTNHSIIQIFWFSLHDNLIYPNKKTCIILVYG